MDFEVWQQAKRQIYKRPSQRAVIEAVGSMVLGEIPSTGFKSVRICEVDDGIMIVWLPERHKAVRLLVTHDGQILERGVDRWPRGKTNLYDDMANLMEHEARGGASVKRARQTFFDKHGIRAHKVVEEPVRRKKRRKK